MWNLFVLFLIFLSVESYLSARKALVKTILRDTVQINGFAKFPELPPWLIDNCNRLGFIEPTPVQENALPVCPISLLAISSALNSDYDTNFI